MTHDALPYLIEPDELEPRLSRADLLIVDVSSGENYLRGHVPGAVHLNYGDLILGCPPAPGLLPPLPALQATLRAMGLSADKTVIAYDDQANGGASRLLWTLEAAGHAKIALLNGGLTAWVNASHAIESSANQPTPGSFSIELNVAAVADKNYVLAALEDDASMLLDARSPQEYAGVQSPSLRNGRIPGAVNLNWLDTIDRDKHLRFKPAAALNAMLARRGIKRDKEIIVYCQNHHRSAHSFAMLRHLGFTNVRGYAGSWAEWGNDPALPMECDAANQP